MNYNDAQLVLKIHLQDDATFSNFLSGKNTQLIFYLKDFLQNKEEHFFYVSGISGCGKSHLLQACCHEMAEKNQSAVYIPLKNYQNLSPSILDNLEYINVICIDDIHCINQNTVWQEALLHLYNRSKTIHSKMLISGLLPPKELSLTLADLSSRLSWGLMYQLAALNDQDKIAALQVRAKERGFELSEEVGNFLLRRCSREIPELFSILEKLDHASLTAQRRLTIPFVKAVLKL